MATVCRGYMILMQISIRSFPQEFKLHNTIQYYVNKTKYINALSTLICLCVFRKKQLYHIKDSLLMKSV